MSSILLVGITLPIGCFLTLGIKKKYGSNKLSKKMMLVQPRGPFQKNDSLKTSNISYVLDAYEKLLRHKQTAR